MKFPEQKKVLSQPPSGSVRVSITYRMLSDSDDDVSIEHRVNGVPREELPEEDRCAAELFWPFLDFSYQQDNRFGRTVDVDGNTVVCQLHKFCVEQYHYGEHTFILRRQFYNADTGTEDYVEMTYGSVLVVPEVLELFSDVKDNAYFSYLHVVDCWDNNRTVVSESCAQTLALQKAWSRLHFLLDCWVTMLIYISLHVYYVWWACTLIRFVLSLTLPELFRPSVARMAPQGRSPHPQSSSPKRRNVFLAYAEADVELSVHVKSILQPYDLNVYDSQQDVAPGQPPLLAWDQAMDGCSGFVVLVSPDYLLQPDLALQFQSIHYLLLEHEVRESDVMLVVAGRCHIPPAIGPLPIIDLQHQHWQRDLEWWAFCFRGQFLNKAVIDQVGRDLQRDTHSFLAYNRRDDEVRQVLPHLSFVFRTLEAICKPADPHSAEHGGKEGEGHATTATRGSSQSGITASQMSALQSPCRTAESVCISDPAEEDVVQATMESAYSSASQRGGSGQLPHLGDEVFVSTDRGTEGAAPSHDVFLTYCEASPWDCTVAEEIKAALEGRSSRHVLFPGGQGLQVYDAVQDLLPGRPDVHLVSAAAKSSAFVVLLSPAYVQDPITRRLHFPQVLQAVFRDAVETESVLIVHTSGSVPRRHVYDDDDDDAVNDADNEDAERQVPHLDADSTYYEVCGAGGYLEGALRLPRWFQAFTHLHWSPCLGLCEEERLKLWARHVHSGVTNGDGDGGGDGSGDGGGADSGAVG